VSFNNTFTIEVDGSALPPDISPLLTAAYVDDSQRMPDMFELRFRDPAHLVLSKTGTKVGSVVKISVITSASGTPIALMTGEVTALEAEFDTGGTFTVVRGYDAAHRLLRGRRSEAYTQMTASDIAQRVAQRAGIRTGEVTSTTTVYEHLSQVGTSDWTMLRWLAADAGFDITVRDGVFGFGPREKAEQAPAAGGPESPEPLVLRLGADLLRFRAVLTSSQQVKDVEVRGWDTETKQPLTATVPARTATVQLPDVTPAVLAGAFGDPRYVATDVPHRTQAEVDTAAKALTEALAAGFAELEGVCRGNPQVRAGTPVTVDGLGAPFDGKYTVTSSRHRLDPTTGYTTSITVSGARDHSMLALTGGPDPAMAAPAGVVIGVVSEVGDPESLGRVRLTYPWLSDDYVSGWARTVQAGAGKDRGAMVLPEVGDEVLVVFEQGDVRRPYVLGGLWNGVDRPNTDGVPLVDGGSGAVNRRSMVSRRGHRVDLLDQDGKAEGVSVSSKGGTVCLTLDATGTKVTVHSDGTVLVEGSKGVVVDAKTAKLELTGGEVSIKGTRGVTVDGGAGPVKVSSGTQLDLKGGSLASLSAALVKIN